MNVKNNYSKTRLAMLMAGLCRGGNNRQIDIRGMGPEMVERIEVLRGPASMTAPAADDDINGVSGNLSKRSTKNSVNTSAVYFEDNIEATQLHKIFQMPVLAKEICRVL